MKAGFVTIISVVDGRGAADKGIKKHNRILRVAGIDVTSGPGALDCVKGLLIGQSGTEVTLVIEYYDNSEQTWKRRTCVVKRG
jgi:C-terminal processing protease CtpA/Prc